MSLRLLDLRGTPPPFDEVLPRLDEPGPDVHDAVAEVLREVRTRGDEALVRFTAELDRVHVSDALRVPPDEIAQPCAGVGPDLWRALELAFGRILAFRRCEEGTPPGDLAEGGITVGHLTRPVERAGLYAPGGRARYLSTVLICVAPARVAGVGTIAVCVPLASDGMIDAATLGAASVAGVGEVYRIGGAQAIAAMAYGMPQPPCVDVIAGPGNTYVAEAKRQLRAWSVWPRPSPALRKSSSWLGPVHPTTSPPSTWSSRPNTGPTGFPGW